MNTDWTDAIDAAEGHETLLVRRGRRSGVHAIVAVHSTRLGPALGGCRMWSYERLADGILDALALSRAMTYKAAAADLPLGGGKSVICLPPGSGHPQGDEREAILHDFADAVELLGGAYITAEDVGTSSEDMALLASWSSHVVGRPQSDGGGGDPGAFTAAGVLAAMHACCEEAFGTRALDGRAVAVVGVGSVGGALATLLARAGADLVLADVDTSKRRLAEQLHARWLEPRQALRAQVDVIAPCALGGQIDADLVEQLHCSVICGAANNQLSSEQLAGQLAGRGILYAPDFVVNAAGLINASLELTGYDTERASAGAAHIEAVMRGVLERAARESSTPLQAARELARERLAAGAVGSSPGEASQQRERASRRPGPSRRAGTGGRRRAGRGFAAVWRPRS